MVNHEVQYEERLKELRLIGYSYYDTPDGEDLHLKLLYTSKIALGVGLLAGTINAYSIPGTRVLFKNRLVKLLEVVWPLIATSTTFTVTTYSATRLRNKDDPMNYVYGGLAAGAIGSLAINKPSMAPLPMLLFSLLGRAKKKLKMQNKNLFEAPKTRYYGSYFQRVFDFSLVSERKGNWTKDPLPSK